MTTRGILRDAAERTGWNAETQLELVLRFLDEELADALWAHAAMVGAMQFIKINRWFYEFVEEVAKSEMEDEIDD